MAERLVAPVGVGEVYVGAGQSNSTNSGSERQKAVSGLVTAFSGGHWQPAVDPLPGVHDTTTKGSYYPPLGDLLAARLGVPVAFAASGHGGTSVAQWQKDAPHSFTDFTDSIRQGLYSWTLFRLQQLGAGGFRAVLWHQGESDSTHVPGTVRTPEQTYYDRLSRLVGDWRADADWSLPFHAAQGTRWPLETDGDPEIRRAVERLWADGVASPGANTDTLGLDLREPAVDATSSRVHFNGDGLKAHAALWEPLLAEPQEAAFNGAGARDSDAGGAPDFWERLHGLDPANAADDAAPSASGLAYRDAFLFGADPAAGGLSFAVRPQADGDTLTITLPGVAGRTYVLLYRDALAGAGTWTELDRVVLDGAVAPVVFEVEPGAAAAGFFRVQIWAD